MNFKRKLWWAQRKNDVYKYSTFILHTQNSVVLMK